MNSRFVVRAVVAGFFLGGIALLLTIAGGWSFPHTEDDLPTSHYCQKIGKASFICGEYIVLVNSKDGKPDITSSQGSCTYLSARTDKVGTSIDDIFICKVQNTPIAVIVNSSLYHFHRSAFPTWSADFCLYSCQSEVSSINRVGSSKYQLVFHNQSIELS